MTKTHYPVDGTWLGVIPKDYSAKRFVIVGKDLLDREIVAQSRLETDLHAKRVNSVS